MESSYKNFLPSRRILILLIIVLLGVCGIAFGPRLIARMRGPIANGNGTTPTVIADPGNPIVRDSDHDGVMDWQEIAANLDPYNPETIQGTPDSSVYHAATAGLDPETAVSWETSSDTDKISYTIFDKIVSETNQSGNIDTAMQAASAEELLRYIQGIAPAERFTVDSLQSVPATPESERAYKESIKKSGAVSIFDAGFQKSLNNYLTQGSDGQIIAKKVAEIAKQLSVVATISVPDSIIQDQVANLNALDGFGKVLSAYQPAKSGDPIYQFATITLIKMYEWAMIKHSAAILNHYGDPMGNVMLSAINAVRGTAQ